MFADGRISEQTDLVQHRINNGDVKSIRKPPRRLPFLNQQEQEESSRILKQMLQKDIIEESSIHWSSLGHCQLAYQLSKFGSENVLMTLSICLHIVVILPFV